MKTLKKALNTVGVVADGVAVITQELSIGLTALTQMGTDELIGARIEQRADHGEQWCKDVDQYRAKLTGASTDK